MYVYGRDFSFISFISFTSLYIQIRPFRVIYTPSPGPNHSSSSS